MLRTLFVCAVVALVSLSPSPAAPAPTETVIRLTVQPMRAPRPALKYQLLPELYEMNPGNPVQGYMLCFAEQHNFFFNKESAENRDKWQTMPLAQLVKEVPKNYGGSALRQADWSARLDTPDWQILLKFKRDGINLLLPDIQQLRVLAAALKVRLRLQIAERRFDDAIDSLKTMFALGHHLGDHPTAIGNLVGIAIATVAVTALDEMLEQPGCPNLYWALTNLPSPLVGCWKGIQGERMWFYTEFSLIDEKSPMTEEALDRAISKIQATMNQGPPDNKDPRLKTKEWLQERANDKARLAAARARLVESGLGEDSVKRFPPLQVILVDEKLTCDAERDEADKAMQLPFWEGGELMQNRAGRAENKTLGELLPAIYKIRRAQARLDQRLALLRCVEAVRLYAAAHDGKLPAKLSDLTVPVPPDPHTGRPFIYSVEGETAKIQGTPPQKEESPVFKVRYEVTIRKEK